MTATPEQIKAIGSAARQLLAFAWARKPRNDRLVTNALIAVGRTFATDPTASARLLRQAIETEHLKKWGYEEIRWIAREIVSIAKGDPQLAINIYDVAYGFSEQSDESTRIGDSALLSLTSNRRQDYEGSWFELSEQLRRILDLNLETGVAALVKGLAGYVRRQHHREGEVTTDSFILNGATVVFDSDFSHVWYRGGYKPLNDGPVLLTKFEDYLREAASGTDAEAKMKRIVAVLAREQAAAAVWASLLEAGTASQASYGLVLLPLVSAPQLMTCSDTRYQVGSFIQAIYDKIGECERAVIEDAILALTGKTGEHAKAILAGCIPADHIVTDAMREFHVHLARDGARRANIPPYQIQTSVRRVDTDDYLRREGVNLDESESAKLRTLVRGVEEFEPIARSDGLSVKVVRDRLKPLERLDHALLNQFQGKVPAALYDHAFGTLAEAAASLARAAPAVLKLPSIRKPLKRILLDCATSANPQFDAEHEDRFHTSLSWGGPSSRTAAANGLLDFTRGNKKLDPTVRAAIRKLARDPVCHVRLQIAQNLGMLRLLDPDWAWSEIEYIFRKEKTRGVVGGALTGLANLAHLDLSRAIRLAKMLIRRYQGKQDAGMADRAADANTLIVDIYIQEGNAEAGKLAMALLKDLQRNHHLIANLLARYSDRLTAGSLDDVSDIYNAMRQRALDFYRRATKGAFSEIESRATKLDYRKFNSWPENDKAAVRCMYRVLDEVSIRIAFAAGAHANTIPNTKSPTERQWARFYVDAKPLFDRLASAEVAPIAHHLVEALEVLIPQDPGGVFHLIAQSVVAAERGGYGNEQMAMQLVVRIVQRYIADYRAIFADRERITDLMNCLDVFVRAGWPAAQSLTFRLGDIWR